MRQELMDQNLADLEMPSVWEQLSRETLNMVKPGEIMYRFYYKEKSE